MTASPPSDRSGFSLAPRRNVHDPETGVSARKPIAVSFEFFPPTDAAQESSLWWSIRDLAPLGPRFVSVTYGADGSTRERTHEVVRRLKAETSLTVVPHLTCIGASRGHVLEIALRYWQAGVRHLVALRGDIPIAYRGPLSSPEGFADSIDFIRGLTSVGNFDISVAAYPEVHPEAASAAADLDHLKAKIDAGADRAITQFFFDTDVYLKFRDVCARAGITAAIVPGILPITKFPQVLKFAKRCGATIPKWLHERFQGLDEDLAAQRLISATVAIDQVERLRRHGVEEFHFYTLNRAKLTYAVCHALGLRPDGPKAAPIT